MARPRRLQKAASTPLPDVGSSRGADGSVADGASSCMSTPRRAPKAWKRQMSLAFKRQDSNAPTEPDEMDMQSQIDMSTLAFDTAGGVFSGWIYVAEPLLPRKRSLLKKKETALPSMRKLEFQRRYCRLQELVCSFFDSEDAAFEDDAALNCDQRVIISVERVHERNKSFVVTDYEDRRLILHTTMAADFEEWFGAFRSAVNSTQVSKARTKTARRAPFGRDRNFTYQADRIDEQPRRSSSDDLLTSSVAKLLGDERLRSATEPLPSARRNLMSSALMSTIVDGVDAGRTKSTWLYLRNPWWKMSRQSRRYFVLSGAMLSCFSVNKEGQLAEFTHEVIGCRYLPEKDPLALEIFSASGRTIHVTTTEQRLGDLRAFMNRINIALGTHREAPRSRRRPQSVDMRGGLV